MVLLQLWRSEYPKIGLFTDALFAFHTDRGKIQRQAQRYQTPSKRYPSRCCRRYCQKTTTQISFEFRITISFVDHIANSRPQSWMADRIHSYITTRQSRLRTAANVLFARRLDPHPDLEHRQRPRHQARGQRHPRQGPQARGSLQLPPRHCW